MPRRRVRWRRSMRRRRPRGHGNRHDRGHGCTDRAGAGARLRRRAAAAGARVQTVTADSDAEIDAVLARLDGPPRADGLTWPDADGKTRLVVATAADGQLRAVVRRLVRRYAPPPSRRPSTCPPTVRCRTCPRSPYSRSIRPVNRSARSRRPARPAARSGRRGRRGARRPDAPPRPAPQRRRLGDPGRRADRRGATTRARPRPWRGRVEVDDAVLSDGEDPLVACASPTPPATPNCRRAAAAHPAPTRRTGRSRWRSRCRSSPGRGSAGAGCGSRSAGHTGGRQRSLLVTAELPYVDDGVAGTLTRKRSWWIEPGAWAVYAN